MGHSQRPTFSTWTATSTLPRRSTSTPCAYKCLLDWPVIRVVVLTQCHLICRSGVLVCRQETVESPATGALMKLIVMDFPLKSLRPVASDVSKQQVAVSLGLSPESVVAMTQTQTTDVMVHIEASEFANVRPDLQAIAQIDAR